MAKLKRELSARHLCMIALGGSLGTGIFLTSGSALYIAGPGGALAAYLIMGLVVYLIMTSLGEMAAYRPVAGSFCQYTTDYVGRSFGFAMGYNYWFNWAVTIAVELIAAALVMEFWFPHINPLWWCALFFTAIFLINILSVRNFGETEFWLSVIKVAAIILFILVGIAVILGIAGHHQYEGWHNWTKNDAPFHGGFSHMFQVFLLSGFAFQGTELVGIAAGETKDPGRTIPKAIRQVFWRILLFYIVTMLVISLIIPYTDPELLNPNSKVVLSPFTIILSTAGLNHAATIMNLVILAALLSACNSDMYSSTRVLWHMAQEGSAPKVLSRTNRWGVPVVALVVTASFGLLALLSNYMGSSAVFLWLVHASSLAGFIAWFGIALSHFQFRRQFIKQGHSVSELPYYARGFPVAPLVAAAVCVIVIVGQAYLLYVHDKLGILSLLSTYVGLFAVLALWLGNKIYVHYISDAAK